MSPGGVQERVAAAEVVSGEVASGLRLTQRMRLNYKSVDCY